MHFETMQSSEIQSHAMLFEAVQNNSKRFNAMQRLVFHIAFLCFALLRMALLCFKLFALLRMVLLHFESPRFAIFREKPLY